MSKYTIALYEYLDGGKLELYQFDSLAEAREWMRECFFETAEFYGIAEKIDKETTQDQIDFDYGFEIKDNWSIVWIGEEITYFMAKIFETE